MLRRYRWLLVTLSISLIAACGDNRSGPQKVTAKQVIQESTQAVEAAQKYFQQQKEGHQKWLEGQLARMDRRLEKLQAKTEKMEETAKGKLEKQLASLKTKNEAAKQKLQKLAEAGDEAWEGMQAGMVAALDDLENTYDQIVASL